VFIAEAGYEGVEIDVFRPHPHPEDFNPQTPTAGRNAVPFVRGLMEEVLG
jgi:hypothetical protein